MAWMLILPDLEVTMSTHTHRFWARSRSNARLTAVAASALVVVLGERSTNDWRIDSRSDSLAAFATGIARPEDGFALIPAD